MPQISRYVPLVVAGMWTMGWGSLVGLGGCRGDDASGSRDESARDDSGTSPTESSGGFTSTHPQASGLGESDGSSSTDTTGSDLGDDAGLSEDDGPRFDLSVPDAIDPDDDACEDLVHVACDAATEDWQLALGINCPGELPEIRASHQGTAQALAVRTAFGGTDTYAAREGSAYVVLGTGSTFELDERPPQDDKIENPRYCSANLDGLDLSNSFPEPIATQRVGDVDCSFDPSLVGTGDCSNTLQAQWDGAKDAPNRIHDYSELRLELTVPEHVHALSYDFAFVTTEYPFYFKSRFNDMYVAWLESSTWTGNISFDAGGNPISLNAGFMTHKDAADGVDNDPDCMEGCRATALHDSCMQGHAGTDWLTTTVPVTPGDAITLVFALFDMSDGRLDSFVFLDNLRWHCEAPDRPKTDPPTRRFGSGSHEPSTRPANRPR